MIWHFDGQDSFEEGVVRNLGIGEIFFKNTLFQSFRPLCSFIVSDMEPSMKYNLFKRSFPSGKTGIFKDFCKFTVRGLHNEILRNKSYDFLSIQALICSSIETFNDLRQIIQVSVENIQARTIAGELDASDAIGTNIRLMNYSYTNAASSRG